MHEIETMNFERLCTEDCAIFQQCETHGLGANPGFACPVWARYGQMLASRLSMMFPDADPMLLFRQDFLLTPLLEQLLILRMEQGTHKGRVTRGNTAEAFMREMRQCISIIDGILSGMGEHYRLLKEDRRLTSCGIGAGTGYYGMLTAAQSLQLQDVEKPLN